MKWIKRIFITTGITLLLIQCEDDKFLTDEDARLSFSLDTVFFDTIFTTIGTTTHAFKVYNKYNKSILISEIYLAGGYNSVFRMNVDGEPTRRLKNKKIGPKDSLFIFIEATINPNGDTLPIVVKDSVVFITNDNLQDIKLMAWGQDIHYFKRKIINSQTWTNDKPYLIYDYLVVDSNEVLTINEGAHVYMHWNSSVIVWGTLQINGSTEKPVIFEGDRSDYYQDYLGNEQAGQWGTIALVEGSKNNIINNTIIKNSIIGLWLGQDTVLRKVQADVKNTLITNTTGSGIISFGADLNMYNTVIGRSGQANLLVFTGGNYNFYHCTFSNTNGDNQAIVLQNYIKYTRGEENKDTITLTQDLSQANFYNSIVYGYESNDSGQIAFFKDNNAAFKYKFNYCLLQLVKNKFDTENPELFNHVIFNKNPKLIDPGKNKFELDTLSPAKDVGNAEYLQSFPALNYDIKGNSRLKDSAPDLGAYERKEE